MIIKLNPAKSKFFFIIVYIMGKWRFAKKNYLPLDGGG